MRRATSPRSNPGSTVTSDPAAAKPSRVIVTTM
jgi:hypothetical protein